MKKYDKRYCKAVAKYGERACMDAASMINSGEGGYNIALSHGVLKKNGDVNTNAVGPLIAAGRILLEEKLIGKRIVAI